MDEKGLRTGHFVALTGALALFASLFRPWYSFEIPQQLRDALGGGGTVGRDPGLLGQMARGLAEALPASISASGWRELEGADIVLCGAAALAVALVLAGAGAFGAAVRVERGAAAQGIAFAGAVALVVAVVHVVHRPGGAAAAPYVHLAEGVWLALGGGAAMLAGGLLAGGRSEDRSGAAAPMAFPRLDPELPPVFTPSPGTPGHGSVPPPGR